jgi:glutathione S-transferase
MKLYVNYAATTSRAVLAFCEAEGVDPEIESLDLMQGQHLRPPFSDINPNRLVPVLDDDGFILTEASAILRYLAAKTGSPLYPSEPKSRARVDELTAWFEANFYKDFGFQFVYPQLFPHHSRGSEAVDRAIVEWGRRKACDWLTVLNDHYLAREGDYLVGDRLTIADLLGASIISLSELVHCPLENYPNVRRWYEHIRGSEPWTRINTTFQGFAESLGEREFVGLS